jgi:hypothetical protein
MTATTTPPSTPSAAGIHPRPVGVSSALAAAAGVSRHSACHPRRPAETVEIRGHGEGESTIASGFGLSVP